MKLRVIIFATFRKPNGEEVEFETPSRRYEKTHTEDIPTTLSQVATDIEIQIDKTEVSAPGLLLTNWFFIMTNIIQLVEVHSLSCLNGFKQRKRV